LLLSLHVWPSIYRSSDGRQADSSKMSLDPRGRIIMTESMFFFYSGW
jgi:hypothetical protein